MRRKKLLSLFVFFLIVSLTFGLFSKLNFRKSSKALEVEDIKYSLVSDEEHVLNPNEVTGYNFVNLIKESAKNTFKGQVDPNFCMRSDDMKVGDALAISFDEVDASIYQKISFSLFASNWGDSDYTIGIYKSGETNLDSPNAVKTFTAKADSSDELYLEYSISLFQDASNKISNITFVILTDNNETDNQIWFNYVGFFNVKDNESTLKDLKIVSYHPISGAKELFIQTDLPTGYVDPSWDGTSGMNWAKFPENGKELLDSLYLNGKKFSDCGIQTSMGGSKELIWFGGSFKAGDKVIIKANSGIGDNGKGFRFINEAYFSFDGSTWQMDLSNDVKVKIDNIDGSTSNEIIINLNKDITNTEILNNLLLSQIRLNGKNLSLTNAKVKINSKNQLSIYNLNLESDDVIVIPKNTIYTENKNGFIFVEKNTITYDGASFSLTKEKNSGEEAYEMPEKVLSDCTEKSLVALNDGAYNAIQVEYGCSLPEWHTNSLSEFLTSEFKDLENSPEGSTVGTYYFGWKTQVGLLFPSTIFNFTQDVEYDVSDELVIKLYLEENVDDIGEIIFTPAHAEKLEYSTKKIPLSSLKKGDWSYVHIKTKDLIDPDGELKYLAVTVHYPSNYLYETVQGSGIYFDSFYFETVEKTVQETYQVTDISEVVPMKENGLSFVGDGDGSDTFDYESYSNVGFIRTDANQTAIRMKLKTNDISYVDFYFVLNGVDLYYIKGGIYYWFNKDSIGIGTNATQQKLENIDNLFKNDEYIDIELGAIPYYVNMIKAGYYAYVKLDGVEVIGEYYAMDEVPFGSYFGLYLGQTPPSEAITLAPVNYSNKDAITVTLTSQIKDTEINIGDTVKLGAKVKGKFYGQSDAEFEVIGEKGIVEIDGDGYLEALKPGTVKVRCKVVNNIGEFYSEEIEFTVLGQNEPSVKKKGCKNELCTIILIPVLFVSVFAFCKKRETY